MSNTRESIKVICRIRPENQREKESGCNRCITNTDDSIQLTVKKIK
jgi:hypothetical protein